MSVTTYGLGEAEAEADGGVGEGRDGGDDGEPGHVVEVGYEGQHHLGRPEEQHVEVVAAGDAGSAVALAVVAVGPQDRPATACALMTSAAERTGADHRALLARLPSGKERRSKRGNGWAYVRT